MYGKLTKSKVLWGRAGLRGALKSGDGVRKFFLSCGVGWGWGKTKPCGAGRKTPSFGPTPPHCHPYMEPTLETINLGNNENPCLIKIGLTLNEKERKDLQELKEFQEVFAWPYEDMPRIDPEIAQHHIDTHDRMVPVKQKLKRMRTEWLLKIKEEVTKQLKLGFIKPVHQAEWIANAVPIPKKDGNVRMCVDFRDLNRACLKDDFPLPHIDVLLDNMA